MPKSSVIGFKFSWLILHKRPIFLFAVIDLNVHAFEDKEPAGPLDKFLCFPRLT